MASGESVQAAVVGELLADLGRRARVMDASTGRSSRSGSRAVGFLKNVSRVPQSVVKRVGAGGCHSLKELKRQMNYIVRDEAMKASWSNQIGIDRGFEEAGVEGLAAEWVSGWAGTTKRGFSDHIILSFPKGTEAKTAEEIARAWGQEVFASGAYRDRYRYVAALHHNTEHVHAHFIVEKHGLDDGKFLSIGRFSEINYDMMRELHADIARDHGLALNATSRLSRGIIENAPRETDIQAARSEDREPYVKPLSMVQRMKREMEIKAYAQEYGRIADMAEMGSAQDADGFWARIKGSAATAASLLLEGRTNMGSFANVGEVSDSVDAAGRLLALREQIVTEAQKAWDAVQAMEPGANKVRLEGVLIGKMREGEVLFGDRNLMPDPTWTVDAERDPYALPQIRGLAARVQDQDHPLHAEADGAVRDLEMALSAALSPFVPQLEKNGTNVEEITARLLTDRSTVAQIEAVRPTGPEDRERWLGIEHQIAVAAGEVVRDISLPQVLHEDMARDAILSAPAHVRLADLPVLDKLVLDIKAGLSSADVDQIARGQMGPLEGTVANIGLRKAVASELRHIADAEMRDAPIGGRDSDPAATYARLIQAHERAAERDHSHDDDYGHGL